MSLPHKGHSIHRSAGGWNSLMLDHATETLPSITGPEIAAARVAKGLTQTEMGQIIGFSRNAVGRWECMTHQLTARERHSPALRDMLRVLGLHIETPEPPPRKPNAIFSNTSRARGDGLLDDLSPAAAAWVERELERLKLNWERKARSKRVVCGAMTRKGTPCRNMSEPGRTRCKFHGGKSTGPKTAEGKARIAEAQRKRWAKWRAEQKPSI